MAEHRTPGPAITDPHSDAIAWLDHDRAARRGYPEAVYCEGKSEAQLAHIAARIRDFAADVAWPPPPTLFTRATPAAAAAILTELPDALHDAEARLVIWPALPPEPTGDLVVIACAGTSDLPVAREAALTARHLGRPTELLVDVGVAGIHRTFAKLHVLREAGAIVVVAGMDGALPSVVAGLVRVPVIAVPTSIGYGAAFGGIAPLLAMLNACAPGIGVVNIDNGYGGGHLAAQITAPRELRPAAAHPGPPTGTFSDS